MKHINKIKLLLGLFLMIISYSKYNAQTVGAHMGFHVGNHLNCSITFNWLAKSTMACTSATNCDSGTSITVPAGGVYNWPSIGTSAGCGTVGDIEACYISITITKIGSTTVSVNALSNGPAGPQSVSNTAPGCTTSTTNYVCGMNGLDIQN